ncbi:hypothetical protein FisN_20Lh121 [Fistulifera solaris]|uniref:Uncharacterized protein n=1 Tax=Fistulifera solaris TaxID=1519565 RepID=A0A1Z5JCV4_FISSO|nr:hypothetical protein FisN_20Lh121 [Fistulifera solaris]|eukprot:GAX11825.1 hypothetical protein FisN_20Lh121 [Fistulifera solaris]
MRPRNEPGRSSPLPVSMSSLLPPMGISKRRARGPLDHPYETLSSTTTTTTTTTTTLTSTTTIIELPPPQWKLHRTAHHLSDAQYARSSYHQSSSSWKDDDVPVRHKLPPPPLFTKRGCVQTCAYFSLIAVGVLLWLGILFDTQPFYIHGALQVQNTYITNTHHRVRTRPVHMLPLERLPAATTAYQTAALYLVTYLACQWYLRGGGGCRRNKQKHYQHIPDHMDTLPLYETNVAPRRYMSSMVQRCKVEFQQYLSHQWGWDTTTSSNHRKRGKHTPKTI